MRDTIIRAAFGAALLLLALALLATGLSKGINSSDTAGWAQALGGVGSIYAAILLGDAQLKTSRDIARAESDARQRADEDRNASTISSAIIKVWRIGNTVHTLRSQFGSDLPRNADGRIAVEHPWLLVQGLGGLTQHIYSLNPGELAAAISLKPGPIINRLILIDERLTSSIDIILLYNRLRAELQPLLPQPIQMEGMVGTLEFTAELMLRLAPRMSELNSIIINATTSLAQDEQHAKEVLAALLKAACTRYPDREWPKLDVSGTSEGAGPSPDPPPSTHA